MRYPQIVGRSRVPALRDRPLVSNAPAPQPEGRLDVGSDDETGRRLASRSAHPSSLARSALCRQTPNVAAGCPNWARPDPCAGWPAMAIPTAILNPKRSLGSCHGCGRYAVRRARRDWQVGEKLSFLGSTPIDWLRRRSVGAWRRSGRGRSVGTDRLYFCRSPARFPCVWARNERIRYT
jgi:hypothetical protein